MYFVHYKNALETPLSKTSSFWILNYDGIETSTKPQAPAPLLKHNLPDELTMVTSVVFLISVISRKLVRAMSDEILSVAPQKPRARRLN